MDAFVEKPEGGGLSEGRLTVDSAIVFIPYASVLATATHLRLPLDSVEELSLQRILSTLPSTRSAVCLVRVSFVSSPSAEQLNLLLPTASEAEFLSLLGKSLSALGKSLKESPGSSGKYTVTSSVNPPPPNATVPTRGGPASKIHGHVTGLLTNVLGAPLTASLEDAGWTVLESFAKVTHAARNTAGLLFIVNYLHDGVFTQQK